MSSCTPLRMCSASSAYNRVSFRDAANSVLKLSSSVCITAIFCVSCTNMCRPSLSDWYSATRLWTDRLLHLAVRDSWSLNSARCGSSRCHVKQQLISEQSIPPCSNRKMRYLPQLTGSRTSRKRSVYSKPLWTTALQARLSQCFSPFHVLHSFSKV